MAEWLGSALQKLLQRFESASDLIVKMESPVVIATAGLLRFPVLTYDISLAAQKRLPTSVDEGRKNRERAMWRA